MAYQQDFPELPQLPPLPTNLPPLPDFDSAPVEPVRKKKTYEKIVPEEPKEKEAEPFGFITNLPKSTLNMAKGVFIDLPVQVAKSIYSIAKDPQQYGKDFQLMLQHNNGLGSLLWHEMSDYYTKDFWHNVNEDPARGLTDVAAVLSGIGAIGKLAPEASRTAAIAARLSEAAHYVDPISGSMKLAGKALSGPLGAIGIGEHTQSLERIARGRAAQEALAAADETKAQLFKGLTPDENSRLERLFKLGVPEEIEAEMAKGGTVAKRFEKWSDRVSHTEEPFWKKNQKVLSDDDMIRANAKAIQEYTGRDGQIPVPAKVAEEMIRNGDLKPTYMSLYRLKNDSLDLWQALNAPEASGKSLGRLNKRLANGEYLTDIDEIQARQIHAFHQAKYKLGLMDEVKQYLAERNKIVLARTSEEAEKAIASGYRRLDDEFYRSYWKTTSKATALVLKELTEASKTGTNTAEALAKAGEQLKRMELAGEWMKGYKGADVYVPAHVAAWMNRELAPISNGWKLYDKWMSRFKSASTVFNPRFWSSVIFGNALLGAMYGLSPEMVRIAMKYKGDLPASLKQIGRHEIFLRDLGIYDRVSTRLGEAASRLDNFYKDAIFTSEIAKDSYARTKFAMGNYYTAQDDVIKAVQYFSQKPEELAQVRLGVAQAEREMSEQIALRDKAFVQLKRAEKMHEKTIERLLAERQISFAELSAAMDARAERLGQALSKLDSGKKKTLAIKAAIEDIRKQQNEFVDAITTHQRTKVDLKTRQHEILDQITYSARGRASEELSHAFPDTVALSDVEREQRVLGGQYYEAMMKKAGFSDERIQEIFQEIQDGKLVKELMDPKLQELARDTRSAERIRETQHKIEEMLRFDATEAKYPPHMTKAVFDAQSELKIAKLTEAMEKEAVGYKYSYFAEGFLSELKKIRTTMKQSPHHIDNAGVVAAMDVALKAVETGHPEWLRHAYKQLKKASNGTSTLAHNQDRLSVFLDMIGAAEMKVKEHTATLMHNAAMAGQLSRKLPLLEREAQVAEHAIDIGNRFYGSYSSLLPFEKHIIRRIVPFYTFTKAMTKLAFQFPYLYPKRTFIMSHLARAWNDVMHDDNAYLPSWAKEYIPVGATKDGGVMMVRIGSFTPLANVRMGSIGEHQIPSIMDFAGQHPIIKVIFDLKGGIPEWSKRPLSPGDSAVRLDNGEVISWTGTGFKTEIAQPSVLKSVFGLFPQAQLIHSLLSPYAQTDRGWLFHPEPVADAAGKPRYPKELSDLLLSFVVPTTSVKLDDLKRMEQVRVATVVKEFQRELRTAPPERRQTLIDALRSWAVQQKQAVER